MPYLTKQQDGSYVDWGSHNAFLNETKLPKKITKKEFEEFLKERNTDE